MKEQIITIYQNRIQTFTIALNQQKNKINWLAFFRLLEFLGGCLAVYWSIQAGWFGWAWVIGAAFGVLFLYLVKIHSEQKAHLRHLEYLLTINQHEIDALNGKISQFADGKEFIEPEHSYAYDLDILGDQSIFQFLNRTTTIVGKNRLADWLKNPSLDKNEIISRQNASKELSQKLDFRQNLQASGQTFHETLQDKADLLAWLKLPITIAHKPIYFWILTICPILTLIIFTLNVWEIIPGNWGFLPLILQLGFVSLHLKTLMLKIEKISQKAKFLEKYSKLLQVIENEQFSSPRLLAEQQYLTHAQKTANRHLAELAKIIYNLENGASAGGIIFNGFFMWSLQYLYRLEKWQMELKTDLEQWFVAISEVDALASLANLAYNQPDYTYPEIQTEQFVLQAENLGHPLLNEKIRVNNPLNFKGLGQLKVITGANMAGKSTYLRTVGVNLILAMNGAVVCAQRFDFQPIPIYTSMRTKDSLQANESFFYAELKRLKGLIDTLSKGEIIFIILDEILKGTNSADQHTGSKALIEQLVKLKGVGLIATHDLSLGELANIYPQNIENQCFEIEISGDELQFDYKLRQGLNQHLNATFLMKKMGITV
jgi:DNA mismatch repair ATPase MutS